MIGFCLLIITLLVFSGCSEAEKREVRIVPVEFDGSNMGCADSLWSRGQQVFLETTTESTLNQLSKVVVWNNRIFILDDPSEKICVFDTTGKFLWHLLRLGHGPGEYVGLTDFLIAPQEQELILYTDRPYKLIRYDLNGKYKSETKLPDILFYEVAMNDRQIVGINEKQSGSANYLSLLDPKNGAVTDELALEQKLPCPVFSDGRQLMQSLHLNFTCRYDNTIYGLEEGRIVPRIRMDFGKSNFPEAMLDEEMTIDQFSEKVMANYVVFSITNVTEDDERFYFTTNIGGSLVVVSKSTWQADYFRQMMDKGLNIRFGPMVPVESLTSPIVGFQQSPSQLKIQLKMFGSKIEPHIRERIAAMQEDDNPVLFFYWN